MSNKRRLTIRDATAGDAVYLADTRDERAGTMSLDFGPWYEPASYRPGSELAAMLDGCFATGCAEPLLDWLIEHAERYGPLAYVARQIAVELAG